MIWKREVTLDALNAMGEGNMVGLLDIRFEHIGDALRLRREVGIGVAHLGDQGRDQTVHQGIGGAQQVGVAHGAAHDAAQDVAPALVRGRHAVGEIGRAHV